MIVFANNRTLAGAIAGRALQHSDVKITNVSGSDACFEIDFDARGVSAEELDVVIGRDGVTDIAHLARVEY